MGAEATCRVTASGRSAEATVLLETDEVIVRGAVKDTDIFAVARAAGLSYTKVVRVSATHTAERLSRKKAQ